MSTTLPEHIRLQVEKLSLSWQEQPVCCDVSFDVEANQIVCLVGRSGSGKTTLFHAVAGLTKPDSGRVLLDGNDITGQPGHISYMLQKDLLLEQHTVLDNACMPLVIGGMPRKQARAFASEQFPTFALEGCQHKYPFQLSGGMRQRAALLRTHLMGNNVLLMDEPFSALDAFTRVEMRMWFVQTLRKLGLSVVLVTHDVDEAIAMGDRILILAGNPAAGRPSIIVDAIDVPLARAEREQAILSSEGLAIKRTVLGLLE